MSLKNFGLNIIEKDKKEDSKVKKTTKKSTKKSTIKKEFKPLIKEEPKIIEKPIPIQKEEIIIQPLTKEEIREILNKKEENIEEDSENVNGNHLLHSEIKSTEIRIKKFIHHEAKNNPISAKVIKSYLYLSNEEFNKYIPIVLQNYPNIKQIENTEFYIWRE